MYTHIPFYISCEVIAHRWGGVGGEGVRGSSWKRGVILTSKTYGHVETWD